MSIRTALASRHSPAPVPKAGALARKERSIRTALGRTVRAGRSVAGRTTLEPSWTQGLAASSRRRDSRESSVAIGRPTQQLLSRPALSDTPRTPLATWATTTARRRLTRSRCRPEGAGRAKARASPSSSSAVGSEACSRASPARRAARPRRRRRSRRRPRSRARLKPCR